MSPVKSPAGIAPADYLVLGVLRQSPQHRSSPTRICALFGPSTGINQALHVWAKPMKMADDLLGLFESSHPIPTVNGIRS